MEAKRNTSQKAAAIDPRREEVLKASGFQVGDRIRVDGEQGVFRVLDGWTDGSLKVVGETEKSFRAFRPEWCFPVSGKLPKDRVGLRAQWRREHGFLLDGVPAEPLLVEV